MRRRAVVLGIFLLFAVGAACSSFGAEDDPAPTSDAGPDVAVVVVEDGGADADATPIDTPPELFAGNQGTIRAMVASVDTLYWVVARSGALVTYRSFAADDSVQALVGTDNAAEIAVDGDYVYWTTATYFARLPKAGGTPEMIDNAHQTSIVVDDTDVYWANEMGGTVHRKAKAHLETDIPYVAVADPNSLALDDTYLFVVSYSDGLQAYKKADGVPAAVTLEPVGDPSAQHSRIAAGGGAVFFRNRMVNLESIDVHGNGMRYIVSDAGAAVSLDSDGTNVFWTEDSDAGNDAGRVRRASANGDAVTDLATEQQHPTLVVAGGDHIYWVVTAADGSSSIMRHAK